jgi:hypothetical protein
MRFQYVTKKDSKGNIGRYRTWFELFKDEDTGKFVSIKRHKLIKINGEKVVWITQQMKKKENRGGKRKGAGRKAKEPTKTMRVPESKVNEVKDLIKKVKTS